MPEPSTEASLQRRANWVGLRTLRQRPKLVGATTDGDPVYEIRSVRLVLRGLSPHFDRLAACARCGKELPAAPVLTVADLDRPLRPVICTDCVKGTGVSSVWEPGVGRPAEAQADAEAETDEPPAAAPAPPPAKAGEPAPAPVPGPVPADAGRLDTFERHLRAVTDRVNELGKVLWSLRSEGDERRRGDEATRSVLARLGEQVSAVAGVGDQVSAQRSEVAAVLSALSDVRSELQRLSDANRELDRRLGDLPPPAVFPSEELTAVVAAHEALERRVAELDRRPPPVDASEMERMVASRLAEVERRLADRIADQWGDLETAIEASVRVYGAGFVRAHEKLADAQATATQRLDVLAAQLGQVASRMDAVASWATATNSRLEALEERVERALLAGAPRLEAPARAAPARAAPAQPSAGPGSLVETLDRQLQDAASRLAARASRAPAEESGRGL